MGKLTFIIGGARSGKSNHSVKLACNQSGKVAFIATAPYYDDDMNKRIERHKDERPSDWDTYEEQKEVASLIDRIGSNYDVILIDCLTLYVSNYLLENITEEEIQENLIHLMKSVKKAPCHTIIVANEVGMGVHPSNQLALVFRDIAGRANQVVARHADDVFCRAEGRGTAGAGGRRIPVCQGGGR